MNTVSFPPVHAQESLFHDSITSLMTFKIFFKLSSSYMSTVRQILVIFPRWAYYPPFNPCWTKCLLHFVLISLLCWNLKGQFTTKPSRGHIFDIGLIKQLYFLSYNGPIISLFLPPKWNLLILLSNKYVKHIPTEGSNWDTAS